MEASINMTIKADGKTYDIKLGIPSAAPTNEMPYTFSVSESAGAAGGTADKLLDLAVGGKDVGGSTNFYVNLAPPKTVLPSDTVDNLAVTVEEGTYSPTTNKFTT